MADDDVIGGTARAAGDALQAGGAAAGNRPAPDFDRRMLEALVCPRTHDTLSYDAERQELVSRGAGLAFPIRAGIPVMLVDEARRID